MSYNRAILTLGREAMGLSQSALSTALNVSQPKVSRVEDGTAELNLDELSTWLDYLRLSPEIVTFQEDLTAPTLSFYRRTQSLSMKALATGNAKIMLRRAEILARLNGSELPSLRAIPHFPVNGIAEAEEAARRVKRRWNVPDGPVRDLIRWVEQAGCVVEWLRFDIPKIDAVAIGGKTPVIFLNPEFPPDRVRLSLAHELGHLVMHRQVHDNVEAEAWAFAAEFLMPSMDIRSELYPLTIEHLVPLKIRWQVSMQALLKRAKDLGRISDRYSQVLWMRMGQYGFRKCEPAQDQIRIEKPTPLADRLSAFPSNRDTEGVAGVTHQSPTLG